MPREFTDKILLEMSCEFNQEDRQLCRDFNTEDLMINLKNHWKPCILDRISTLETKIKAGMKDIAAVQHFAQGTKSNMEHEMTKFKKDV